VRLHGRRGQAAAVLSHPIYEMLISSVAGMQELIAIERLGQAIDEGFDTVVVDTAPSRHALEFLDKPEFFAELQRNVLERFDALLEANLQTLP